MKPLNSSKLLAQKIREPETSHPSHHHSVDKLWDSAPALCTRGLHVLKLLGDSALQCVKYDSCQLMSQVAVTMEGRREGRGREREREKQVLQKSK